ncbi:MAG TPA: hypothetical protein VFL91_15250 [Thermomicrobiales bacterium]|nr:hypothetical protein [Thermomicrobiales bacterium]
MDQYLDPLLRPAKIEPRPDLEQHLLDIGGIDAWLEERTNPIYKWAEERLARLNAELEEHPDMLERARADLAAAERERHLLWPDDYLFPEEDHGER